jgi:undecaprenyl-diphosphatase
MKPMQAQISHFDLTVTRRIQAWPRRLQPLMKMLSFIGHPASVTITGLLLIGYEVIFKDTRLQLTAVIALFSLLLSAGLKQIWHRTRPDTAHVLGLHTYSFPSGHSYGSVVIYGLIAWLISLHLGRSSYILPILILLIIAGIGISRVYLGAHYPSDVAGGWILGGLILVTIVRTAGII